MASEEMPMTPLSPPVLAILLSLAGGDRHGYAMMKDARTPEGGAVTMGPGTLYGTLDRLMRDGLVKETGTTDDERRRYYRLTALGRTTLAAELERLEGALKRARAMGLLPKRGRA